MGDAPQSEGGLLGTVARMLRTLRDVLANRAELFLIEWQEERLRLLDAVLLTLVGAVSAMMALVLVTFLIIMVFWQTHPWLVLGLLILAYAGTAVAAFWTLRSRLRRWQAFPETLEQLKKDRACFEQEN